MLTTEVTEVIAICGAIGIPSIISGMVLRMQRKKDKQDEERSVMMQEQNVLVIRGMQVVSHSLIAVAENQKFGHTNGKTDGAIESCTKYEDDLNAYLIKQNARVNSSM